MNLIALTASHKTGELSRIEKISHRCDLIAPQLTSRPDLIAGCICLATCNRFEIYVEKTATAAYADVAEYIVNVVATASNTSELFVQETADVLHDTEAVEHLFNVAASLDSMAIGEREIVGQVRTALRDAQLQRTTSPTLELAFQHALKVGKAIGTETGLSTSGRSLVDVAVDLALQMCAHEIHAIPTWGDNAAVIIGTGAYAGATVATLRNTGCTNIYVYSHSGRAVEFSESHDITPIHEYDLINAISQAQVVITCSGTGPIVTIGMIQEAQNIRTKRSPIIMIDMALRHDIHQLVGTMKNVELINLETIQEHAPEEHSDQINRAHALVKTASEEFDAVAKGRNLNDAVIAVRSRAENILRDELEKLPDHLNKSEAEQAMRRLTNALLHTPTMQAKKLAADNAEDAYLSGIKAIYDIEL